MSKEIWLFKEHQNFQVGKTKLRTESVFETNIFWISLGLVFALVLIAIAGNSLRLEWRYWLNGAETIGTITACEEVRGTKGSYTSYYASYRYVVNDVAYTARDNVGNGRVCSHYSNETPYTIYYLSDEPEISGIREFLRPEDWFLSYTFALFGGISFFIVVYFIIKNREDRYKYALLSKTDTILEGTIVDTGKIEGLLGYHYANYTFRTPEKQELYGRIRSNKQYPFPENIERYDHLKILFLDDETYCVL